MPKHKPELFCQKEKNVLTNDFCSCYHCTLAVCRVCGAYEDGLTTDCPGVRISSDVMDLVMKEGLDYKDDRGWYVIEDEKERLCRPANFEPTSKGIIQRLANLSLDSTSLHQELQKLRDDAKYWLTNPSRR